MRELPLEIFSGYWNYGHCQGIAVDVAKGFIYYSFTTALIKTDLNGKLIGTVTGLLGHLGCIDFCREDGRVYGSLEYKNDAIGRGILNRAGHADAIRDAFYIAIFDVDKIDRVGMDACSDGVMTTVYLREVIEDYTAEVVCDGKTVLHRHGCSGIDGTTFGPMPGSNDNRQYLFVAYGIYSDVDRTDNDNQVILCYDTSGWKQYERPISQDDMHTCGPEAPLKKLFVKTGNTNWGIQNLLYDPYTGHYLMAVYPGRKPHFPNHPMYIADGHQAPHLEDHAESLSLLPSPNSTGWNYPYGSTGMHAIGDGRFYISYDGHDEQGYYTRVKLCHWDGISPIVVENV